MSAVDKFKREVESIERFYSPAQKIEARDTRIRQLEKNALSFAKTYDSLVKELENEKEARNLIIHQIKND